MAFQGAAIPWLFEVSSDGQYIAVLQETALEVFVLYLSNPTHSECESLSVRGEKILFGTVPHQSLLKGVEFPGTI